MKLPIYKDEDKISGKIDIKIDGKNKLDHMGIKIELIGLIETDSKFILGSTFMSNGLDLEPSGTLYGNKEFDFSFDVF